MSFGKIKFLAVEIDDADLADATERVLSKDDLAFGETGDSQKVYLSGDDISSVEFFRGTVQTNANRKARADITYDADGLPTTETWVYYQDDGTTIKKTITLTHTWSGDDLSSTSEAVT